MTIFDRLESYGFVHHRALNDVTAFELARKTALAHPGRVHIFEGDVCWNFADGRQDIYFRHPSWIVDTLSAQQIDDRTSSGSLVRLEDLARIANSSFFVIAELKVGRGDRYRAMQKLTGYLQANFPGRFWIDGFSLPLLRMIKSIDADIPVTLHTEFVRGGRALAWAPDWPLVQILKLADLDDIEGIAIRWRGGEGSMERAARDVEAAGKALLISRIHNLRQFERSYAWNCKAGYAHWDFDELVRYYDSLQQASGVPLA